MIESRNSRAERTRMARFFMPVSIVVMAMLTFGLTYSLFAYTLMIGEENLDFARLVAPVDISPAPPDTEVSRNANSPGASNVQSARLSQRVFSSIDRPTSKPSADLVGKQIPTFGFNPRNTGELGPNAGTSRLGKGNVNSEPERESGLERRPVQNLANEIPPPVKSPKPKPVVKSKGVINGFAKELIKPRYPESARAIRLTGQVQVQVTLDEDGNVIDAHVIKGHGLFRDSVLAAARATKFTPTFLSDQKVKVTGVIIYNFNG